MKRMLTWLTGAGAVLTALYLATGSAQASVCSFSIAPITFSEVDTLSSLPIDVTTNIGITCSSVLGTSICPSINAGSGGVTGGNHNLQRVGGGGSLQFRFFQDAARTIPWGSQFQTNLGAPPLIQLPAGNNRSTTRALYVRIFPGQSQAAPGSYQASFTGTQTAFVHGEVSILNCLVSLVGTTSRPQINVSATVQPNCLIGADDLDFGIQGVLNTPTLSQSAMRVRCTPNTNYSIALNNGSTGTSPTDRRMIFEGRSIQYGLYLDVARLSPWGTAPGTRRQGTGSGQQANYTIYGLVPAQTTPPAGIYRDTIVVTVEY